MTPGGLHEKMLTERGEQAKTETSPPPPEGQPDIADMEKILETACKYGTETAYLSEIPYLGKRRRTRRRGLLIRRSQVRILPGVLLVHHLYTSAGRYGNVHLRTPIAKSA
jgi:hypothetical protein